MPIWLPGCSLIRQSLSDVYSITPSSVALDGSGAEQTYRTALIGSTVLSGGESIATNDNGIGHGFSGHHVGTKHPQALYVNTQRWLRCHGLTEAVSVPSFGLDDGVNGADSALALARRLAARTGDCQATFKHARSGELYRRVPASGSRQQLPCGWWR